MAMMAGTSSTATVGLEFQKYATQQEKQFGSDFPTGKGAVLGPFSSWGRNVETDAAGTTPVLRLEPTPDGRPAAPPAVRPIAVHQHAASAAAVSITV
jgi:hypothetical protein